MTCAPWADSLANTGESFTLHLRNPSRAAAQQALRGPAAGATSPSRLAPVEGKALSYPATIASHARQMGCPRGPFRSRKSVWLRAKARWSFVIAHLDSNHFRQVGLVQRELAPTAACWQRGLLKGLWSGERPSCRVRSRQTWALSRAGRPWQIRSVLKHMQRILQSLAGQALLQGSMVCTRYESDTFQCTVHATDYKGECPSREG